MVAKRFIFFALGIFAMVNWSHSCWAGPQAHITKFRFNLGPGWGVDSSKNSTFTFGTDFSYLLTPHTAIGAMFDLFSGDGVTTEDTAIVCSDICLSTQTQFSKVTLVSGAQLSFIKLLDDELELSLSLGAGYIRVLGEEGGITFPVGAGAMYVFGGPQGESFGLGTQMSVQFAKLEVSHVIWNWRILSFQLRF